MHALSPLSIRRSSMPRVETLGQALPDLMFEAVRDPVHDDRLLLHARRGRKFETLPRLRRNGTSYVPMVLPDGLSRAARFPARSAHFGTTAELIDLMRNFLVSHASLQAEATDLFLAFVLSSWFCDAMPVAPMLYLFGPDCAVSRILRLLGCLCRRAILIGD